jgi:D-methionine transport system ATP-binding protein
MNNRPNFSRSVYAGGAAGAPMISIDGVSRFYPATKKSGGVHALRNVDISVRGGEIYGVIGRSGAGKSTLLRAINGLERPTAGRVCVDGADISALRDEALRAARRKIGMIFQHFNLLSSRTTFANVALPLEFAGLDRKAIRARVESLLELVGIADKRDRYPVELSGGQKQRVGVARALATEPKVLLSDEATSALDPETTRAILALLADINRTLGVTIVLITHEMSVIKEICHRVGVMEAGEVIEEGDVYDVITRPQTQTARSFLSALSGRELPRWLAAELRPDSHRTGTAVLRLGFTGARATEPTIARLARKLGADIAILQAQVDDVGGRPFGSIIVTMPVAAAFDEATQAFLADHDVAIERLGYVD